MAPLFVPLVCFVAGIVCSAPLDAGATWRGVIFFVVLAVLAPSPGPSGPSGPSGHPLPGGRAWGAFELKTLCVLLALFCLGATLRGLERPVPIVPAGEAVRLIGGLRRAPEWRGIGAYLDIEVESVDDNPAHGRARLTEFLDDPELRSLFDELQLGGGDRIEVVVRIHRPWIYRNPGVFDYRRHLERQGIYWTGTIRNPRLITVLSRGRHGMDRLRSWIDGKLDRAFADSEAAKQLVSGMVLGRRQDLPANLERQFQAGGLYHLLVVSGFNLAVVAVMVFWLARYVPHRGVRLIVVLTLTSAYALLVEGQAPVARATLMSALLVGGKLLDRGYSTANAMCATAFVLLLVEPVSLEDPSFQMTFAAVVAILGIGAPAIRWHLGWLRTGLNRLELSELDSKLDPRVADWRVARRLWCELHGMPIWTMKLFWSLVLWAGELVMVSVGVELVFVFFMAESFHRVSPVSIFLNVVAGPIAAVVTPLGLLALILPGPFADLPAWIAVQLLALLMWVLEMTLRLPFATFRVPSAPAWIWIAYLSAVALSIGALWKRRILPLGVSLTAAFLIQAAITFVDFSAGPPACTTVTFLDVGQGDSVLVEFPDGRRVLIDGGGVAAGRFLSLRDESTFSIGENVVSAYLFSRGIRRLDAVVLTHAHHDHMDGLSAVLENFSVGELWLGRGSATVPYLALLRIAQRRGIPLRWLSAGQTIDEFTVLHPPSNWMPRKNRQNDDSVVLLLRLNGASALLTGDIERALPFQGPVDLLKVPHHGSRNSRLRVSASLRVISVGANNPFGHPHPGGLPALRTDRLGMIRVELRKGCWKKGGACVVW